MPACETVKPSRLKLHWCSGLNASSKSHRRGSLLGTTNIRGKLYRVSSWMSRVIPRWNAPKLKSTISGRATWLCTVVPELADLEPSGDVSNGKHCPERRTSADFFRRCDS